MLEGRSTTCGLLAFDFTSRKLPQISVRECLGRIWATTGIDQAKKKDKERDPYGKK